MNPLPRRLCFSTVVLVLAAGASLPAATPVIGTQLFQETDARIDDLFQYRINPPKPPARRPTILFASATRPSPAPPVLPAAMPHRPSRPGASDDDVLRQAAGTLVFGGLLQIGDVQVLVINKGSYKQGGILGVRVLGTLVYLRIVSITANSVTLGLNEARLTLRF